MLDIHEKTDSPAQGQDQKSIHQSGLHERESPKVDSAFGLHLEAYQNAVRSVEAIGLTKGESLHKEEDALVEAQRHLLELAYTYEKDEAFESAFLKEFGRKKRKNTPFGLDVVKLILMKHGSSLPKATASDWAKDLQGYRAAKITSSFESVYDFRNTSEDIDGKGTFLTRRRKAHAYAELAKTTAGGNNANEKRRANAEQTAAEKWRLLVDEKMKSPVGRLKSVDRSLSIVPASFALALVRATDKGLDVIDIVEDDQQVIRRMVMPRKTKQSA